VRAVPLVLTAAGLGFGGVLVYALTRKRGGVSLVIPASRGKLISYDTPAPPIPQSPTSPASGGYVQSFTVPKAFSDRVDKAVSRFSPPVIAAAKKWAAARGLPLREVLATIALESGGVPNAWKNDSVEDSRGLMQVNVRAWKSLLDKAGFTPADLFDPDKGVQIGTYVYAAYRKKVQDLLAANPVEQVWPIDTLARLYYAGPKYVEQMLKKAKKKQDTAHPFKNAETYIAHWQYAMNAVGAAGLA
jgi:soluble lytic murein transglycosylase-like protein